MVFFNNLIHSVIETANSGLGFRIPQPALSPVYDRSTIDEWHRPE